MIVRDPQLYTEYHCSKNMKYLLYIFDANNAIIRKQISNNVDLLSYLRITSRSVLKFELVFLFFLYFVQSCLINKILQHISEMQIIS